MSAETEKKMFETVAFSNDGLFKSNYALHMDNMVPSKQNAPTVNNLPRTGLHETDLKFIKETVKVISNIDGANEMKLRIHDKLPSVYSLTIQKPPKMRPDDLKQLQMLNTRLKNIKFDFHKNRIILLSWKYKKEPQSKKRPREYELTTSSTLPSTYNLEMVDKMDLAHVSGIITHIIDSTELEFNLKINTSVRHYRLVFSKLEVFV